MHIKIKTIHKTYKQFELVIDHLFIDPGSSVALLGKNGAGKTTLLKILLDLTSIEKGEVFLGEVEIHRDESWKAYTNAYLGEEFLVQYLTPKEYFKLLCELNETNYEDFEEFLGKISYFFPLTLLEDKKLIRAYSSGMKKRIGIASAFIGNPKIILLDEPFANLDPSARYQLGKLIELERLDRTLLLSSHDLHHVNQVCNTLLILDQGKIVLHEKNTEMNFQRANEFFIGV